MALTLTDLEKEIGDRKDELVLCYFDVVRLAGVIEEPDDFYWVLDYGNKRGIVWSSCVGGWIPLKGHIPDKDYERLVNVWNLNHATPAK